jgi:DNA-binding NarL/FixJ family response regulator
MVSVMVVDDHPIWREGVARDLGERGCDVVATAADGPAAVRIAPAVRPQVVLMDLNLGASSGVDAIAGILAKLPETRVLVLSASGEHADVLEALKAGATGYLVKSAGVDELIDAVRRTADGVPVFTPGLAGLVLGEYRRLAGEPPRPSGEPAVPALTERETEVLRLVAKGLTARQIGERLVVSHRTVESHVQNTLRKLQLHNRSQLVRYAIEQGLADDCAGRTRRVTGRCTGRVKVVVPATR